MTIDIRKPMKKLLPFLEDARNSGLNEADTVLRLTKVFEDVLGYDSMREITREQSVRDKYVDLAIKVDGKIAFLVEVKSGSTKLKASHIEQAELYASKANIPWVLLTNGLDWNLYHLTFDEGIQYDLLFEANLSADYDLSCEKLSILHRKSVGNDGLDNFWQKSVALSPNTIGKVLFSEDVLTILRRELKKIIKVRVDEEELVKAVFSMFSQESRENIGPPRIRRKRKQRAKKEPGDDSTGSAAREDLEIISDVIDSKDETE